MASVDGTPFLPQPNQLRDASTVRAQGLRHAARLIRRASTGRRRMREPSMAVRETAAQEIEDRQGDWAYSRPVVALDAAWNLAFITVAIAAMILTRGDSPRLPLRLWIVGYALLCVVHVVCVSVEYFRRNRRRFIGGVGDGDGDDTVAVFPERGGGDEPSALISNLESANTIFSFIWWMVGFYWICVGSSTLQQDSPTLYWLCIVFLVLDLFFVMFCVALASVIAAAVCCCLPCIIAILYVLADQGGATKEDIELLPKYTFHCLGNEDKGTEGDPVPCGGIMRECETDSPIERRLSAEDAECCICLSSYEDGIELRGLPCSHHFHSACVEKWLYINSTCPLCKYDISQHNCRDGEAWSSS